MTFESYLMEEHAKQYIGTDDNMPDDFNEWLCNLETDEWLLFGDWFGNIKFQEALDKCKSIIKSRKEI